MSTIGRTAGTLQNYLLAELGLQCAVKNLTHGEHKLYNGEHSYTCSGNDGYGHSSNLEDALPAESTTQGTDANANIPLP